MLDHEFTKVRITMLLQSPLELSLPIQKSALTLEVLKETKSGLETRSFEGALSLSLRRQIYVLDKIIKNYAAGSVIVTNNELLRHLKSKTGTIPSGYQISSHSEDIRKLLGPWRPSRDRATGYKSAGWLVSRMRGCGTPPPTNQPLARAASWA